jgi:putative hydrolase of the HAD superfamily
MSTGQDPPAGQWQQGLPTSGVDIVAAPTAVSGTAPRGVLLDYGHTLAEFDLPTTQLRRVAVRAAARSLEELGCLIDPQALDAALLACMGPLQARGCDIAFGRALAMLFPDLPPTAPLALERAMRRATARFTRPAPGALTALVRLRAAGCRLAVVSDVSLQARSLRWELDALGFGTFAAVVTSGDVGRCKPDPRIFATALSALGLEPREVCHVGDWWEGDVLGARAQGIRALWRRADPHRPVPDVTVPVLDDLGQLPRCLGL